MRESLHFFFFFSSSFFQDRLGHPCKALTINTSFLYRLESLICGLRVKIMCNKLIVAGFPPLVCLGW